MDRIFACVRERPRQAQQMEGPTLSRPAPPLLSLGEFGDAPKLAGLPALLEPRPRTRLEDFSWVGPGARKAAQLPLACLSPRSRLGPRSQRGSAPGLRQPPAQGPGCEAGKAGGPTLPERPRRGGPELVTPAQLRPPPRSPPSHLLGARRPAKACGVCVQCARLTEREGVWPHAEAACARVPRTCVLICGESARWPGSGASAPALVRQEGVSGAAGSKVRPPQSRIQSRGCSSFGPLPHLPRQ